MTMTQNYSFNKTNRTTVLSLQSGCVSILKSFFSKSNALIGKPVFIINSDKVIVQVFYYKTTNTIDNINIDKLGNLLTRYWNRTVELQLIYLNHPISDSSIFAEYFSSNSKKYSFNRLFDLLKASLPTVVTKGSISEMTLDSASHVTGVKIKLSGRLTTQRVNPRQTVNTNRLGSFAKGYYGNVDLAQHTSKNKLGAFTVKVWVNQQTK